MLSSRMLRMQVTELRELENQVDSQEQELHQAQAQQGVLKATLTDVQASANCLSHQVAALQASIKSISLERATAEEECWKLGRELHAAKNAADASSTGKQMVRSSVHVSANTPIRSPWQLYNSA